MTPKERAVMQQALLYLEAWQNGEEIKLYEIEDTITALREALADQAEQEPVAFQMICPRCKVDRVTTPCPRGGVSDCPMTATAQNAAPVRTKDLTDAEIHGIKGYNETREMYDFAHAVICAYKEKQK